MSEIVAEAKQPTHGQVSIHIDRTEFHVPAGQMTGSQLRSLPTPPIGPDRDLYQEVHGGTDELIGDGQVVQLKEGMRFFSAPHTITPGR